MSTQHMDYKMPLDRPQTAHNSSITYIQLTYDNSPINSAKHDIHHPTAHTFY